MFEINSDIEDLYEEEVESYMDKESRTTAPKIKKLRARRRIETMREQKRLKRQLDDFYYE